MRSQQAGTRRSTRTQEEPFDAHGVPDPRDWTAAIRAARRVTSRLLRSWRTRSGLSQSDAATAVCELLASEEQRSPQARGLSTATLARYEDQSSDQVGKVSLDVLLALAYITDSQSLAGLAAQLERSMAPWLVRPDESPTNPATRRTREQQLLANFRLLERDRQDELIAYVAMLTQLAGKNITSPAAGLASSLSRVDGWERGQYKQRRADDEDGSGQGAAN